MDRQKDGRTDGRTELRSQDRASIAASHGKNEEASNDRAPHGVGMVRDVPLPRICFDFRSHSEDF